MADPNIRSYRQGGDTSRTEVTGTFPAIQPMTAMDQLRDLMQSERSAPRVMPMQAPRPRIVRERAPRPERDPSAMRYVDPLAGVKAMDQYEATLRGAATRPTGLGAQMIPGMAVDPRLAPQRMLPSQSNFQNMAGPSMAGIDDTPEPGQRQTSNAGFDYLPASEQARWLSAYGRQR